MQHIYNGNDKKALTPGGFRRYPGGVTFDLKSDTHTVEYARKLNCFSTQKYSKRRTVCAKNEFV